MTTTPFSLTPDQFAAFRQYIYSKCGIYFQADKKYLLEGRLQQRIVALKLPDAAAYLKFLQTSAMAKAEMDGLFDAITINETYFYRHPAQIDTFRDKLVPEILETRKKAGRNEIRLWSAACSTGDEPYTLALALREKLGSSLPQWKTYIYACDLSPKVLIPAKAGLYNDYSVRHIPQPLKDRYLRADGPGKWVLDPTIRSMVTFDQANLSATEHLPRTRDMDVIFCRNVLIYFDAPAKTKVIESFYQSLRPGGSLIIGPAESLHGIHKGFKMVLHNGAVVYKKE